MKSKETKKNVEESVSKGVKITESAIGQMSSLSSMDNDKVANQNEKLPPPAEVKKRYPVFYRSFRTMSFHPWFEFSKQMIDANFRCMACGRYLASQYGGMRHYLRVHVKYTTCPICKQIFDKYSNWEMHYCCPDICV